MFASRMRWIVIASALVLGGGVAGLVMADGSAVQVTVARPVLGAAVPVFGLGTVEARVVSDVGFQASGVIVEVTVDQGDMVSAGGVLARLDTTAQTARLARAEAQNREAEAALTQAEARLQRAVTIQAQKRRSNDRRQALVQRGTVSPEAAEEAAAEAETAGADVAVAQSDRIAARAAVDAAAAQVEIERRLLGDMVLRAPFDALVVERRRELGSVVASGTAVFKLVDPRSVWVRAYVDESVAGATAIGQPAEIRLRSKPAEPMPGRVARIDLENDRVSEERIVHIAFDRIPEPFTIGEQAEVMIESHPGPSALVVPASALDTVTGASGSIWVVADGSLSKRSVQLGRRFADGRVEILSGLSREDSVVIGSASELREGRAAVARVDTAS